MFRILFLSSPKQELHGPQEKAAEEKKKCVCHLSCLQLKLYYSWSSGLTLALRTRVFSIFSSLRKCRKVKEILCLSRNISGKIMWTSRNSSFVCCNEELLGCNQVTEILHLFLRKLHILQKFQSMETFKPIQLWSCRQPFPQSRR